MIHEEDDFIDWTIWYVSEKEVERQERKKNRICWKIIILYCEAGG